MIIVRNAPILTVVPTKHPTTPYKTLANLYEPLEKTLTNPLKNPQPATPIPAV